MLTGAAPVMKSAPQGAARALGLGRVAGASRNQKRTAIPNGKYDFFGCTQHSFGRWLKRGLRGHTPLMAKRRSLGQMQGNRLKGSLLSSE